MPKKKYYKIILVVFLITGLIISLPQLLKPINAEADAYARVLDALYIRENPHILKFQYGVWLPMHSILLSLSLLIYNNYFLSPRIITLLFSLAGIISLFFYSQIINDDKKTSLVAALLYLFFPLRILLSTLPLTETIFNFFMITSVWLFFKKKPNYFVGLLFLAIAQSIRYEAWFLVPFICWFLLSDKNINNLKKLQLLVLSFIFPVFWLYRNYINSGDPLYFWHSKVYIAYASNRPEYGNLLAAFNSWSTSLLNVFPLILVILTVLGFIFAFPNKKDLKQYFLLILPFFLFFLLIIQTFLGTMEWFPPRYLSFSLALCFPLMAKALLVIYSKIKGSIIYLFLYFSIIISFIVWQYPGLIKTTKKLSEDDQIRNENSRQIIDFLKKADIKTISYYFSQESRLWQEPKISYFTAKKISVYPKSTLKTNYQNGNDEFLIVEKDNAYSENFLHKFADPIVNNSSFVMFDLKK